MLPGGDTIAAIATPCGPGGIGIVRVSGPLSITIRNQVFRPSLAAESMESHRMYLGWAVDPASGSVLDEVLAVVMKAPRSYTREDVLEIHCHGGPAVLRAVLGAVVQLGARPAGRGEFTKRAVLNGRMDLAQAEAVLDLVRAESEAERAVAAKQLSGACATALEGIRSSLLSALAHIEAAIDFPEEDIETLHIGGLVLALEKDALLRLDDLLETYRNGRILREGARIVLAGRPNVGKSSLFNAFLGMGRVLVSPIPGTTRDVIEETIELSGLRAVLVDTAGIDEKTDQPLERLGCELSRRELEKADLVLLILDASTGILPEDKALFASLPPGTPYLAVFNKTDIPQATRERAATIEDKGDLDGIPVSALTGAGLSMLRNRILDVLLGGEGKRDMPLSAYVPNLRQKRAIEEARDATLRARDALQSGAPPEIAALDLREALSHMDTILGAGTDDEVLDQIFSRFCIGK